MSTKILVVDDDIINIDQLFAQNLFHRIYAKEDFSFFFSSSGHEAYHMLCKSRDIHIVLTDLHMEGMDGLSLMDHLFYLDRMIKIIAMSFSTDLSSIRLAMHKGAIDFITKPIDFKDLEITFDRAIALYQEAKENKKNKDQLLNLEKELEIAQKIQQAMIPKKWSLKETQGNFDLMGVLLPAQQIGGDFFDYFALDDQRVGIIIADVSGKSISASLFMAITKTLFRSIASTCSTTDEALLKASQLLSHDNSSCMFVTAFYAIFNPFTGTLCYTNAGHAAPYILSRNGVLKQISTEQHNLPLGLDESLHESLVLAQKCLRLNDQDCLILFTDGLTEAMNAQQELYSQKRLVECLKKLGNSSVSEIIEEVIKEVKKFTLEAEQSDDLTLLCLRYYKKPIAESFSQDRL